MGQTCMSVMRAAGGMFPSKLSDPNLNYNIEAPWDFDGREIPRFARNDGSGYLPARNYILPPLEPSSAWSGSLGALGLVGLEPLPVPAAPPLLINTKVPEMATPAGPMLMKPPEALMVSCMPASITTFMPALRWISMPASWA